MFPVKVHPPAELEPGLLPRKGKKRRWAEQEGYEQQYPPTTELGYVNPTNCGIVKYPCPKKILITAEFEDVESPGSQSPSISQSENKSCVLA